MQETNRVGTRSKPSSPDTYQRRGKKKKAEMNRSFISSSVSSSLSLPPPPVFLSLSFHSLLSCFFSLHYFLHFPSSYTLSFSFLRCRCCDVWLWLETTSVMMTKIAIIISICFAFFSFSHRTFKRMKKERKSFSVKDFFSEIHVYITLSFVTLFLPFEEGSQMFYSMMHEMFVRKVDRNFFS